MMHISRQGAQLGQSPLNPGGGSSPAMPPHRACPGGLLVFALPPNRTTGWEARPTSRGFALQHNRSRSSQKRLRGSARTGFTLLEVLAALALSTVLIAAVYSGLDLCYRYSSAGREEVERAQIARAVLRQMERDLRGVVYHAPAEDSSSSSSSSTTSSTTGSSTTGTTGTSGSSSSSSTGSSTSTTTTTTTEDAAVSSGSGLFGNSNTLMLHVSHPTRDLAFGSLDAVHAQSRGSDLMTVAYFVGGSGTGALQNLVKTPGLLRMQGERLAMSLADQQSNLNALAGQSESLATEVLAVQFRYFDGFDWRNDWDSTLFGGVPKAVEITIELPPPVEKTGGTRSTEQATVKASTVVALPLGKPITTSSLTP